MGPPLHIQIPSTLPHHEHHIHHNCCHHHQSPVMMIQTESSPPRCLQADSWCSVHGVDEDGVGYRCRCSYIFAQSMLENGKRNLRSDAARDAKWWRCYPGMQHTPSICIMFDHVVWLAARWLLKFCIPSSLYHISKPLIGIYRENWSRSRLNLSMAPWIGTSMNSYKLCRWRQTTSTDTLDPRWLIASVSSNSLLTKASLVTRVPVTWTLDAEGASWQNTMKWLHTNQSRYMDISTSIQETAWSLRAFTLMDSIPSQARARSVVITTNRSGDWAKMTRWFETVGHPSNHWWNSIVWSSRLTSHLNSWTGASRAIAPHQASPVSDQAQSLGRWKHAVMMIDDVHKLYPNKLKTICMFATLGWYAIVP